MNTKVHNGLLLTLVNGGNTGFGESPTECRPIFKKFGLNSKIIGVIVNQRSAQKVQ